MNNMIRICIIVICSICAPKITALDQEQLQTLTEFIKLKKDNITLSVLKDYTTFIDTIRNVTDEDNKAQIKAAITKYDNLLKNLSGGNTNKGNNNENKNDITLILKDNDIKLSNNSDLPDDVWKTIAQKVVDEMKNNKTIFDLLLTCGIISDNDKTSIQDKEKKDKLITKTENDQNIKTIETNLAQEIVNVKTEITKLNKAFTDSIDMVLDLIQ